MLQHGAAALIRPTTKAESQVGELASQEGALLCSATKWRFPHLWICIDKRCEMRKLPTTSDRGDTNLNKRIRISVFAQSPFLRVQIKPLIRPRTYRSISGSLVVLSIHRYILISISYGAPIIENDRPVSLIFKGTRQKEQTLGLYAARPNWLMMFALCKGLVCCLPNDAN